MREEFKYGQKGTPTTNLYTQKTTDIKKPDFSKYYSVEKDKKQKGKKQKIERKPGRRSHERIYSSTKRKLSLDEDGKSLKNSSRLEVSTEKKTKKRKITKYWKIRNRCKMQNHLKKIDREE